MGLEAHAYSLRVFVTLHVSGAVCVSAVRGGGGLLAVLYGISNQNNVWHPWSAMKTNNCPDYFCDCYSGYYTGILLNLKVYFHC